MNVIESDATKPPAHEEPAVRRMESLGGYGNLYGLAVSGDVALAVGGQGSDVASVSTDGRTMRHLPVRIDHLHGRGGLRHALVHENTIWVCGEYGLLARSSDAGRTFTTIRLGTQGCLFGVTADDAGRIWVAGDDGFLAVSASGRAFKKVGGIDATVCDLVPSPLGVLIPTDKPGRLHIGHETGLRTTSLEAGVDLEGALVTPRGTLLVVGGTGAIFRSEDDGESFERVESGTAAHLTSVDCLVDGRVVVVGKRGSILVSYDDGRTFVRLDHMATTVDLWCCARYGEQMLVCGDDRTLLVLGDTTAAPTEPRSLADVFGVPPAAAPDRPEWAAPPAATELRSWCPSAHLPIEKRDGLYATPWLRAQLWPRRGGIATAIRPLPTVEDAWTALRACFWEADPQAVWAMLQDQDPAERGSGTRLMDPSPRRGTAEQDIHLCRKVTDEYGTIRKSALCDLTDECLTDYLVASVGLAEAVRRAFAAFEELPYVGVGPFGRFRELMVLADDATYAEARSAVLHLVAEWKADPEAGSSSSPVDFLWAASFLLPLGPGAPDEDRAVHTLAVERVRHDDHFSSTGAHACGLASGDLATLQHFLTHVRDGEVNSQHCFAVRERMYLASLLEIEGVDAAPTLATMKPGSPWTDDPDYNGRWCTLLAHLDHPAALEALYGEHRQGHAWGTDGLLLAGHLDKERVLAFAREAGDSDLADAVQARCTPDVPRSFQAPGFPLSALSGQTSPYRPPAHLDAPASLAGAGSLATEWTWTDEEREAAEQELLGTVSWNGRVLCAVAHPASWSPTTSVCTAQEQDEWLTIRERYAVPVDPNTVAAAPERFARRLRAIGYTTGFHGRGLSTILLRDGVEALPLLQLHLEDSDTLEYALPAAMPVGEVSLAPPIITAFTGKKLKAQARTWLMRHPRHAALGAILMLADAKKAPSAARALRFLDANGHRQAIMALAEGHEVGEQVYTVLTGDPMAAPGAKLPTLPAFATPASLPAPIGPDGRAASPEDVQRLLLQLAFSQADEPHPAVLAARATYTPASRADFAWALFEAWLAAGADPKHAFCMQAVGFLGDDECARKLTALAKDWPGQNASARAQAALDALLNIGTDTALMNISLLSEKSKFPAFKAAAAERIDRIALARGLSRDELQDRLVPRLGLDESGADVLDFGPRQFHLSLNEYLVPVIRADDGRWLKDLPRPTKADDAVLAKAAKTRLSAVKKDLRAMASLQLSRFERAMILQRRWSLADFQTFFVHHPVLIHLVRRLVLGAFTASDGRLLDTFRVAEDATFADSHDDVWTPPAEAFEVGIPHRLELSDEVCAPWFEIFGDYEIQQPFAQLTRATHRVCDEPFEGVLGRTLTAPTLVFGLEGLGWKREGAWDGGAFNAHLKNFGDVTAEVSYTGAVGMGYIEESELLTVDAVTLIGPDSTKVRPDEVSPVVYSEIVADLTRVVGST